MKTGGMNSHLQNVTIVIRSARERTERLCKELILEQGIQEENLFIVQEVPFSAAMKKSFQIGIEQEKRWTFCVDADVLLRPGSIEKMVEFAETQKENICEIQGYVMDKFFGGPRQAGNHLYRTSLLNKVIERIPEEGKDIRPERYTLGKMREDGYPWMTVPYITGIHDAEQYNIDIYRKAFVQAVKHLYRTELFVTLWKENCDQDHDYKVALKGFSDSIQNAQPVYIDKTQTLYADLFRKTGFQEKPELETDRYSLRQIDEIISKWVCPEIYFSYFPARDGMDGQAKAGMRKIKKSLEARGMLKTCSVILSDLFIGFGNRIRRV